MICIRLAIINPFSVRFIRMNHSLRVFLQNRSAICRQLSAQGATRRVGQWFSCRTIGICSGSIGVRDSFYLWCGLPLSLLESWIFRACSLRKEVLECGTLGSAHHSGAGGTDIAYLEFATRFTLYVYIYTYYTYV